MSEKITTKSLKSNLFFNVLRKLLTYLFPIIIFPYVNRVLGPENIGSVRFAESVVNYFVLFTGVGIPSYGLRVIARTRDSLKDRSKAVWELTSILAFTSIIGYVIYFFMAFYVGRFRQDLLLFLIISPTIFLTDFSYEWFYQGIENQSFITIRFIIVKLLQILFTFLLIHSKDDYYIYAAILVGMSGISALFNIFKLKDYISWVPIKELNVCRHLKSLGAIFISSIAISVYTQLDVTMVGFIVGDAAVGYYTTSNTIVRMVIVAVTAFAEILTPRIENSLNHGDINKYREYLNLSITGIMLVAFPACLGIKALASDIILLFAGPEYARSIACMGLLSPIIIISGLAYFVGSQILYSQRTEWKYSVAVVFAAIVNASCNLILIPKLGEIGAVIGTLIAETLGLFVQFIFARKVLLKTALFSVDTLKIIISSVIMYIALKYIPISINSIFIHCMISVIIGVFIYSALIVLCKVDIAVKAVKALKNRISK